METADCFASMGLPEIPDTFEHRNIYFYPLKRNPTAAEAAAGIWVDRVGVHTGTQSGVKGLRILGLYMLVGVEWGKGFVESLRHGRFEVQEGDALFVQPDDAVWYGPTGGVWQQRWVIWGGPEADRLAERHKFKERPLIISKAAAEVRWAQPILARLLAFQSEEAALEAEGVLRMLVARVLSLARYGHARVSSSLAMADVVRYIQEHLNEPLKELALAQMVRMSESLFRRRFKELTGQSPKRFLVKSRIHHAQVLLAGGAAIKEAANAVGISDVCYFMRLFKQEAGITAGQFAAKRRTGQSVGSKPGTGPRI